MKDSRKRDLKNRDSSAWEGDKRGGERKRRSRSDTTRHRTMAEIVSECTVFSTGSAGNVSQPRGREQRG